LALDVIHQVGPGGEFISTDHTMEHFRDFWEPALFNRQRVDDWLEAGSQRLGERLRDRTVAILEDHEPEPLSEHARQEIEYILESDRSLERRA
ncbi:MAG: trimethylamine methyltransferase family protein, partial [Anaerolineae bacterium]|nr:trimethylamine methyltransferase family protein [Anaerolineae bacterium]